MVGPHSTPGRRSFTVWGCLWSLRKQWIQYCAGKRPVACSLIHDNNRKRKRKHSEAPTSLPVLWGQSHPSALWAVIHVSSASLFNYNCNDTPPNNKSNHLHTFVMHQGRKFLTAWYKTDIYFIITVLKSNNTIQNKCVWILLFSSLWPLESRKHINNIVFI